MSSFPSFPSVRSLSVSSATSCSYFVFEVLCLLVHEQELGGVHEGVAEIDVGGGFVGFEAGGTRLRLRGRGNVCLVGVDLLGLRGEKLTGGGQLVVGGRAAVNFEPGA